MTLSEVSKLRLQNQQIESVKYQTPKELVSWMGAIQAQDFHMAKWAMGLRVLNSTTINIEDAYNEGQIIRTHLMRPTWHVVAAEDVNWMLELTAPQIKPLLKSRDKQLELDEGVYSKTNAIIEKELLNKKNLTREELSLKLENANIKTDNNRLSHIMLRAELDGIVCSGPLTRNKLTYSLLSERIPIRKSLNRNEALAELAKRYFKSHCPATLRDFIWWSGLSVTDARNALQMIKYEFVTELIDTEIYLFTDTFCQITSDQSVHLLPAFDEFLISYKDRSAAITISNNKKAISENGIFRPIIVVDGHVTGLWKRTTKKDKLLIEIDLFHELDNNSIQQIETKALQFGNFMNKQVELIWD